MSIEDISGPPRPCTDDGGGKKSAQSGFDSVQESLPGSRDGIQQGLVAYFDILGFTTIASDENIRETAKIIRRELLSIPKEIEEEKERKFGRHSPTKSLIFADSILLWYNIPKQEVGSVGETYHWFYFCWVCAALMQRMFNKDLPLRGAISEGEFFIEGYCFVGKPIIDCHKLAEQSDWSGCAIVPAAWQKLEEIWQKTGNFFKTNMEQVCMEYSIPLKQMNPPVKLAQPSPYKVIKWLHVDRRKTDQFDPCISESVDRAFTGHGKKVGEMESGKVANTKEYLKFVDSLYVNCNRKRLNQSNQN